MRPNKTAMGKLMAMACLGLCGMVYTLSAQAAGTLSGTPVNNRAQIDYEVGGVGQTPIESAPGAGNSTPGVGNGTDTQFVVDNRVDLTVLEVGAAETTVSPGELAAVTEFLVTNTGNTVQDFALTPVNLVGGTVFTNVDTIEMSNVQVFVDDGSGIYEAGTDVATFIDELAADGFVTVFIVADVPLTAVDDDAGNVQLTATVHDGGGAAALGALTVGSAGPDDPAVVDVVIADAGGDGFEVDADSYHVAAALLSISKASAVISDPINGASNSFAIPGAVMEYTITITNGGATDATAVRITDVVDANLTFVTGTYNSGASDVEVTVGAGAPTYCIADALDVDNDGCELNTTTLEINPGITIGTTAPNDSAVIRFQVSIN